MTTWVDLLENPEALKVIFDDDLPNLDLIYVHELTCLGHGPEVVIRFDIRNYPMVPPKKWENQRFNQVQLILHSYTVHELRMTWTGMSSLCVLKIEKTGSRLHIDLIGDSLTLSFKTEFLRLDKISAYQISDEGLAWRL